MLLQVHDELIFEVAEEEADALISNVISVMETACQPRLTLSVPLVVGEPEVASPPEPAVSDQRDVAGLRVFCVDNDPALLASLEALLRALGCDPIVARSRADALEEVMRHHRGFPPPPTAAC